MAWRLEVKMVGVCHTSCLRGHISWYLQFIQCLIERRFFCLWKMPPRLRAVAPKTHLPTFDLGYKLGKGQFQKIAFYFFQRDQ